MVKKLTTDILKVNKNNRKVCAYLSFHNFKITGEEKHWKVWASYSYGLKAKEIIKLQKDFLAALRNPIYISLHRVAISENGQILGNEISFVLAVIHQVEYLEFDEVERS